MYAVFSSGGKQYRVEPGSLLTLERLSVDAGARVTFDRVLLVGDGDAVTVGTPTVSDAVVTGTVLGEELGPKLIVFKFKQKVKYRRTTGHRQHLIRIRVDEIRAGGRTETAPETEAPKRSSKAPGDARQTKGRARQPKAGTKATGIKKASATKKGAGAKRAAEPKGSGAKKPAAKNAASRAKAPGAAKEAAGGGGRTRRATPSKDETKETKE